MKLCCSSRSFARSLHSGALTQLEWIDRCAELAVDGVEFGAAHFPRTDLDYLAQLKKLCVDRGLTVASLALDLPFGTGDVDAQCADAAAWLDRAAALGAPLARIACGAPEGSPGVAWRELVRGLKTASAAAKDRNVTLALEGVDAMLVATPADARRAMKECDSAWLRLAIRMDRFASEGPEGWRGLAGDAVILTCGGTIAPAAAIDAATASGYIGFVSLDEAGQGDEAGAVRRALGELRRAIGRS
jgi:sugar phosphate isomerase/epimerase